MSLVDTLGIYSDLTSCFTHSSDASVSVDGTVRQRRYNLMKQDQHKSLVVSKVNERMLRSVALAQVNCASCRGLDTLAPEPGDVIAGYEEQFLRPNNTLVVV